jgi:hypothetical protein
MSISVIKTVKAHVGHISCAYIFYQVLRTNRTHSNPRLVTWYQSRLGLGPNFFSAAFSFRPQSTEVLWPIPSGHRRTHPVVVTPPLCPISGTTVFVVSSRSRAPAASTRLVVRRRWPTVFVGSREPPTSARLRCRASPASARSDPSLRCRAPPPPSQGWAPPPPLRG